MRRLKKFNEEHNSTHRPGVWFNDNVEIVNKSELGKNWSAEYEVNIAKGLKPYIKQNGIFTEVASDKTLPKTVVYLKPTQVEQYNYLGEQIKKLEKDQADILK